MTAAFRHALLITGFVLVMMLVVEYLNVLTGGRWQRSFPRHPWLQYVLAALLGATPGCLGAFAVVTLYAHGVVRLGALTAAMIATSGDEAFVMFALFPGRALLLTGILVLLSVGTGHLVDLAARWGRFKPDVCARLEFHPEERCDCFPLPLFVSQWRRPSLARVSLAGLLLLLLWGVLRGVIGPPEWGWLRLTVLGTLCVGLFIVASVPEHFLQEHLWRHVACRHGVRIYLWTAGALLLTHLLLDQLHLEPLMRRSPAALVFVAGLVGLIPESGPHLVFATLFAQGAIPFAALLASSIVQDGHGMLPLLAHSRRVFLLVKTINLAVGLAAGLLALLL